MSAITGFIMGAAAAARIRKTVFIARDLSCYCGKDGETSLLIFDTRPYQNTFVAKVLLFITISYGPPVQMCTLAPERPETVSDVPEEASGAKGVPLLQVHGAFLAI